MGLKLTYVLPGIYLFLVSAFLLSALISTGHGSIPFGFVVYLSMPGCLVLNLFGNLANTTGPFVAMLSCLMAGLPQYVLIGFVIDWAISRRRMR